MALIKHRQLTIPLPLKDWQRKRRKTEVDTLDARLCDVYCEERSLRFSKKIIERQYQCTLHECKVFHRINLNLFCCFCSVALSLCLLPFVRFCVILCETGAAMKFEYKSTNTIFCFVRIVSLFFDSLLFLNYVATVALSGKDRDTSEPT